MAVKALPAFKDNYIWILTNTNEKIFDCVDPGDAQPVLKYIEKTGYSLRAILLTHHHYDHTGGVNDLKKKFPDVEIYGPEDNRIPMVKHIMHDQQELILGDYNFKILNTPGHTSTHICYFEPEKQWLFCGDTLFSAGCGRVFDGTISNLYQSLMLLKKLPDTTSVYCAHEYTLNNLKFALKVEPDNNKIQEYIKTLSSQTDSYCSLPSTISLEKEINPFFRVDSPAVKSYARNNGINPDNGLSVFKLIRNHKDHF